MPDIHKKGWGYENWLVNNELYCGKILHFELGSKCSLHYHKIKDETFYVLNGTINLYIVDSIKNISKHLLSKGDSYHILPGVAHAVEALVESDIIEISTQHFEDDSYRIIKGD